VRRLTNKRLALFIVGVAAVWAVEWALFLAADPCGAEDELECTTAGWVSLYGWLALAVALAVLLGIALVRVFRRVFLSSRGS
jgi:hypothetical protein